MSLAVVGTNNSAVEVIANMYQYEPLDQTRQQIRLMKLYRNPFVTVGHSIHPQSSLTKLSCSIRIFDLDNAPAYTALSYTWGRSAPVRRIRIDGKDMSIRVNLHDFLEAFCNDPANTCYLWIDQLCIDQQSDSERNHQVRLMSRIYKQCTRVIAWLDLFSTAAAEAFSQSHTVDDARVLLTNPYFARLWIIQEIHLSPEAWLFCGRIWIPWKEIADVVARSEYHRGGPLSSKDWLFMPHAPLPIVMTIERYGVAHCQDPKDRVYGLLGLVREDQQPVIDYSKTLPEIFADVINVDLVWVSPEVKAV
ncbi:hypothetical protein NX059_009883 [Plenodomus lindquistii]|nr:hypothetical protein NX059_009883 [Plenodomus lindquistii]